VSFLIFIFGVALLVVVTFDFLFTTIGAQERTIISLRVTRSIFRWLRRTAHAESNAWPHRISGPLVMSGLAGVWFAGTSLGWTLIFTAVPASVEPSRGQPPPGWWDVFAHVGHLLSTLGAATTVPASTVWYVTGAIVAINGMVILTLAVSFTLSTTQTVAKGRAFAALTQSINPADTATFVVLAPWLSELCSSLKSSPFALFYSTWEPTLRLPSALVQFAEDAARGDRFDEYCRFLRMLPDFDPDEHAPEEEFLAEMRDWCAGYSLSD
jgi:hypothetical protein